MDRRRKVHHGGRSSYSNFRAHTTSTRLTYTGLYGGLEHLKIETRLKDERFESVMGECDLEDIGAPSTFKLTHRAATLSKLLPIFDLSCPRKTARV